MIHRAGVMLKWFLTSDHDLAYGYLRRFYVDVPLKEVTVPWDELRYSCRSGVCCHR